MADDKEKSKELKRQSSTPYDDVFRTMLNDCTRFVLPLLNEVFGEHYDGSEKIVLANDYHFKNIQDGIEEKIITDSSFKIIKGTYTKKYHLECQSTIDNSMVLRFFEYDSQIALDDAIIEEKDGQKSGGVLTLIFPHSAVLFLRSNKNTSDVMTMRFLTPGGEVKYKIPIIKMQKYTLSDIWEKEMYLLLPFYIFTHEANLKVYNEDKKLLQGLLDEFSEICGRLNILAESGRITEFEKRTIIELSEKVVESIAVKYENVRKGVGRIMGGKVIETEAKKILNKGISQGISQGVSRGKVLGAIEFAKSMNMSDEEIIEHVAEKFGLSREEVMEKILELGEE